MIGKGKKIANKNRKKNNIGKTLTADPQGPPLRPTLFEIPMSDNYADDITLITINKNITETSNNFENGLKHKRLHKYLSFQVELIKKQNNVFHKRKDQRNFKNTSGK